jgi:uncharacterized protein
MWGMLAHLSALLGLAVPLGSVLAPLVVWLVKREQSAFVADQAKEALNFNITVLIGGVICIVLAFVFIGILLGIALFAYWLVFTILAGIKANEGALYRYPFAMRMVK